MLVPILYLATVVRGSADAIAVSRAGSSTAGRDGRRNGPRPRLAPRPRLLLPQFSLLLRLARGASRAPAPYPRPASAVRAPLLPQVVVGMRGASSGMAW